MVQAQLLGQELALWRDDAGAVNAWANRCPHRGVRLSIGIHTGGELRCRYHGWRFAAGSGRCTLIPAHPGQKPASTLHATVHRAVERHGYVWVGLGRELESPRLPVHAAASATTLRSMFVNAPADAVRPRLLRGYYLDAATRASVTAEDEFTLTALPIAVATSTGFAVPTAAATPMVSAAPAAAATPTVSAAPAAAATPTVSAAPAAAAAHGAAAHGVAQAIFLLQPVTESQTVIHGLVYPAAGDADRIALLRFHNTQLSRLRDDLER